jgi:hypothetical protein
MAENVIAFSESYRRKSLSLVKYREDDLTNVVTQERVLSYRERHYTETFGTFMREWVAFSEDRRNGQEHPFANLRCTFDAFMLAATNHAGFLQRRDTSRNGAELRRVKRIILLLGKCNVRISMLLNLTAFYGDEMDDCFSKIDLLLLTMEKEFGLIRFKPAKPASL